ncbi:hypothetical protein [uncultured Pedobacter sp.]|nr:hypothetical protein [uncultured Pedobacter sp.]
MLRPVGFPLWSGLGGEAGHAINVLKQMPGNRLCLAEQNVVK